jgi:DNA (cytosine-5)-methyltransferase 1
VTDETSDSEEATDDDTPMNDDVHEDFSFTDYTPPAFVPLPKEFELPSLTLDCANIRPGDVVELVDNSGRDTDHLISGDFLLIRAIVESMKNGDVTLRGYRMRRCAYLQPLFDSE